VKVLNLCFADSAGAAYTLSHALNKQDDISSINLRANNNYLNYPSIAEIRNYNEASCRGMIYEADVLVFHTAVKPFYTALHLDTKRLKDKKKLLYFHGSDARAFGTQILKQADDLMKDYKVLVSTPDLLTIMPDAEWMPVARSFREIRGTYGLCRQDAHALRQFKAAKHKIVLGHAPTSKARKGSEVFYKIITEMVEAFPDAEYQGMQNMPWDSCLRAMANVTIYYDQLVIGAYGCAAVEASIFKAAVFCLLRPDVIAMMEQESGLRNPFIQFGDASRSKEEGKLLPDVDALRTQSYMLIDNPRLQRKFGRLAYEYAKRMHDEKPVTKRFLSIVDAMS